MRTNLIVSLDEDVVSGETSVINMKTTDAGNIIIECVVPKVAIKLSDLEEAVKELRSFFIEKKHIEVVANSSQIIEPQLSFEYGIEEE
jgi:hypothetical protein